MASRNLPQHTPTRRGAQLLAGIAVAGFGFIACPTAIAAEEGRDPAIRAVIDTFRQAPGCAHAGIILGVNQDGHEFVYSSGAVAFADGHAEPVSPETKFQIGSVTKAFTATLYAQLVAEGKLKPDQQLRTFLPPGTQVPAFKDPTTGETTEITLDTLVHHTSGLPRQQVIGTAPFTDERMYATLDRVTLKTKPGAKYLDSQLGIALLAKVLERASGQSMADLMAARITRPMHLDHTHLFAENDPQLPLGVDRANLPAERSTNGWPAYEGSSALVSNLTDMMTFLSANMGRGPADGPIAKVLPVLQTWQTVPCATAQEGGQGCASIDTGLAWSRLESKVRGLSTVWKNGMTKGFSAWIGFVAPAPGEPSPSGVVVLSNQASCPVGPLASCTLASLNGRPPAPVCAPAKLGQ